MKTKQLFAILVALLMVSSIAAAGPFDFLANMIYKKAETGINNAATDKGILANDRQLCTQNADCTRGTCTSCKCIANIEAVTPSLSMPAKTPTVTGIIPAKSLITLPTGKAVAISLPSSTNLIAANAKASIASTPKANGITCTSAADCQSGYCKSTSATSSPAITKQCAVCTANAQCGTGKVCIIASPDLTACYPLQAIGGVCNENSDCASNNCADKVTTGATIIGHCATAAIGTASAPAVSAVASPTLSASSGVNYAACLTECKAKCRIDCGTTPSTGSTSTSTGTTTPQPNGRRCAANKECEGGYCNPNRVCTLCTLNSQCDSGKVCIIEMPGVSGCLRIQGTGGVCNENSDCTSNNCANKVTLGATVVGQCAAALVAAKAPLALSGLKLTATGAAIALPTVKTSTSTSSSGTAPASTAVSPATTSIGTCTSRCEANCETTCRASSTPAKIANNEACNNPAHCENQCVSGKYECACEETALLAANNQVQAQAKPENVEASILAQEMEKPAKINLAPIEAKLANLERKAIADRIVTAEEAESLKLSYDLLSDEKKLENLKARYNFIIDALLEDSTLTDAQKAELRESKIAAQEAPAAITPAPQVKVGFFKSIGNLFSGKAVFTGYVAAPRDDSTAISTSSTSSSASSTSSMPPTAADIAGYKSILRAMDNNLTNIETRVCNKLKTLDMNRGPPCRENGDCGSSTLMACEPSAGGSKYCKFDIKNLCPEGLLTLAEGVLTEAPSLSSPVVLEAKTNIFSRIRNVFVGGTA